MKRQLSISTVVMIALLFFAAACSESEDAKRGRLTASEPEDKALDVALDVAIVLTFSEQVRIETITIQSEDGPCEDTSIRLSANDFETCLGAKAEIVEHSSNRKIAVTPNKHLTGQTTYGLLLTNSLDFLHYDSLELRKISFSTKETEDVSI